MPKVLIALKSIVLAGENPNTVRAWALCWLNATTILTHTHPLGRTSPAAALDWCSLVAAILLCGANRREYLGWQPTTRRCEW